MCYQFIQLNDYCLIQSKQGFIKPMEGFHDTVTQLGNIEYIIGMSDLSALELMYPIYPNYRDQLKSSSPT